MSSAPIEGTTAADVHSFSMNSNTLNHAPEPVSNDPQDVVRALNEQRYGELLDLAETEIEENLEEYQKYHEKQN